MGRPDELLLKHVLGSFLVGELRPSGRRRVVSSSMSTTTPPHKHAFSCDKAVARIRIAPERCLIVQCSCDGTRSHGADLLAIVHEHEVHGVEEQVKLVLVTFLLEGEAWSNFQTT